MNTNIENNELNANEFPTLSKLEKKNSFTVKENFFENQFVEIQQKCYTQSHSSLKKPAFVLKWIAAASVLGVFVTVMSIYMFSGNQKINLADNSNIQETQLAELIDNDDIDENTIVNVILEEDTIVKTNKTESIYDSTNVDVSDEDILKYLIEEGYDLENN